MEGSFCCSKGALLVAELERSISAQSPQVSPWMLIAEDPGNICIHGLLQQFGFPSLCCDQGTCDSFLCSHDSLAAIKEKDLLAQSKLSASSTPSNL